ncbi:membrane protein insertase YidC [Frigoribacterium sp. VKM Ac-2836]|uniref:membrane protein insertase YidC n=1 Tax=Frigoribacterium sp. VKM Ac-2836 TaxID=2739014 RepID=UPI001563D3E8|nr:membrane protein insertase YidC [Frigoribacterium sp. VKM Ac-2836]NRD27228.1 membrane protein insertase YidC [Frigoribacterium sp. VKM Ac-2836]
MDLSTFPPIAVVLGGLQSLVTTLGVLVEPVAGASAAAFGVVLLTLLVRLVLVPVGVSQVRAEIARRRLAPAIADLTRRISDPQARSKALMALYASEKVSPAAGCLPTLAQAPVLTAVYSLFAHSEIAGHANTLLTHTLGGAALGANLFVTLGTGLAAIWPYLVLLVVLGIVVELGRRANLRFTGATAGVVGPAGGAPGQEALAGLGGMLRWLPYVSVVFAAFAPLAAALYLVTSATWTLGERAVLRRVLAR